jgi:hypothetical protein
MAKHIGLARWVVLAAVAVVGAGCLPHVPVDDTPTVRNFRRPDLNLSAEAGREAQVTADPGFKSSFDLANSMFFGSRTDPFALLAVEKIYDRQQASERVLADFGGSFSVFYEPPPPPPDETVVNEPLPTGWRLSAILIGDGVGALLERPSGTIEIRPGQRIEGTEWTVVSIDEERAVLRRSSDRRPSTFVVRLQGRGADFGSGGGFGGGAGSQGGRGGGFGGGGIDDEGRGGGGMGDR